MVLGARDSKEGAGIKLPWCPLTMVTSDEVGSGGGDGVGVLRIPPQPIGADPSLAAGGLIPHQMTFPRSLTGVELWEERRKTRLAKAGSSI